MTENLEFLSPGHLALEYLHEVKAELHNFTDNVRLLPEYIIISLNLLIQLSTNGSEIIISRF
jgi:hypothetical protein